jgi:hypothetical protein
MADVPPVFGLIANEPQRRLECINETKQNNQSA